MSRSRANSSGLLANWLHSVSKLTSCTSPISDTSQPRSSRIALSINTQLFCTLSVQQSHLPSRHPYHLRWTARPEIRNSSSVRANTSCMRLSCMLHWRIVLIVSPRRCSSRSRAVQVGSFICERYTPSTVRTILRIILFLSGIFPCFKMYSSSRISLPSTVTISSHCLP